MIGKGREDSVRERIENMKKNKDKSIKSAMKSWIMLSDKELDDTQVYMKEQEAAEDGDEAVTDEEDAAGAEAFSKTDNLYSDRAGLYNSVNEENVEAEPPGRHRSRDEEITQLMQEVGQEVVRDDEEGTPLVPRRRRKRHKEDRTFTDRVSDDTIVNEKALNKGNLDKDILDKDTSYDFSDAPEEDSRIKRVDFPETQPEMAEESTSSDKVDKPQKTGGMGKIITAGIGILLVLIIGGLGYQNQNLQKQNQKLKMQVADFQKAKKQAEKDSEEQALQTKNEDGVVVNTDKMFASVKVGDKEYKLLSKVSDFTKDGWKLEALRTENATLVPGGKLEKDAFLTNTEGKKIGVIIRNMSDKNQKVSDCIVTKLSFSKEMFDGQITLPEKLGFDSSEKELKAAGFKKDNDGTYCYTSKKIKDDTIKMPMADGENVSEITLERNVDEAASATNTTNTGTSSSATEDTADVATTSASDNNTTASTAQ